MLVYKKHSIMSHSKLSIDLIESGGCILNTSEELEILQQRLVELVHSYTCLSNAMLTYACSLPYCFVTKVFIKHMHWCDLGNKCSQKCFRSRSLFDHWQNCVKGATCQLCEYVRRRLAEYECFRPSSHYYDRPENSNNCNFEQNNVVDLTTTNDNYCAVSPSPRVQNTNACSMFSEALSSHLTDTKRQENQKCVLERYLQPEENAQRPQNDDTVLFAVNRSILTGDNRLAATPTQRKVLCPVVRCCRRCSNHGTKSPVKNHGVCPFKTCMCIKCSNRNTRKQCSSPYLPFQIAYPSNQAAATIFEPHCSSSNGDKKTKIRREDKADWITYSPDFDRGFLVEGGESMMGEISYVGRSYYQGHLLPVAISPPNHLGGVASIRSSFNGRMLNLACCEALIVADFEWVKVEFGNIPSNAVFCKIVNDEDVQYIGRVLHNQETVIGRVSKQSGCLYVPSDNDEVIIQQYEVLVDKSTLPSTPAKPVSQPPLELPTTPSTRKKNECAICYETPIAGIFKECMHACLCFDCIEIVNRRREYNGKVMCPICRRLSDRAERFYLP